MHMPHAHASYRSALTDSHYNNGSAIRTYTFLTKHTYKRTGPDCCANWVYRRGPVIPPGGTGIQKLLEKWEEQARRQDAIQDAQEKQLKLTKRYGSGSTPDVLWTGWGEMVWIFQFQNQMLTEH